jgi:hypothetical protein
MLPILLTVSAVALAAVTAAFFPLPLVVLTVATWPVALLLLWQTRDVVAPEERIAAVDVERARASASAGTRKGTPLARAA